MDLITEVGSHLYRGLPALGATIVVLIAARYFFPLCTPFRVSDDLLDAENPATGVVFGAYLLSAAFAIVGTHFGLGRTGTLLAAGEILVEGAVAVGLLGLGIVINDRLILYRFCIVKEIREDRNLGVAFCVAGSCIAGGLIMNGALTGFSKNFAYGLRDIVAFWLLGQAVLVCGAFLYHRFERYDVHELIEYDDNVAVGIGFGAFLVSLGLVVRGSLVGAGLESLGLELPRTLVLALVGIAGVIGLNVIATLLIAWNVRYEDDVEMHGNVAVSTVTACASVAAAVLIASFIQR